MDKIEQIKKLVKQLNIACDNYYVNDNPTMSDKNYDVLYDELTDLELQTNYILSSSPTQKVQGSVISSLVKVQHTEPMLSAEKSKDINDVIKFMGNQDCVLSWKLDGLTLVLKYNEGKFQQAVTRGGGDYGEDVSEAVKTFANIPLTIDYVGYLEIRGEGLVEFKEFERINAELVSKGEEEYSSPRNLAAGSVRQLDATITKKRNLIFITFGIVKCDEWFAHKMNQFMFLKSLGFTVVEHTLITKNEIVIAVDFYKTKIESLLFLTDGLIVEFNDLAYGKAQGFTGHHNKSLFALKHSDDSYETIFRGVELNTTRTGIVSLIGLFDEVDCDGAKVSRASLHNYDVFQALELGVDDTITVYRANSVIPQIEENLTRSGTYKINMECPSCGGKVTIRAPKVANFLFCDNVDCPSKLVNKFVHFCSKNAMNIDGLSDSGIEMLTGSGCIEAFDDIYNLEQYKKYLVKLPGWGVRSYNNLIEAIDKSRKVKCSNFIYALGIPNIGVNGSKIIAKHFNNDFQAFIRACVDGFDFSVLEDFGDITSQSIHTWYKDNNEKHLWMLLMDEIEIVKEEKKGVINVSENPFKGTKCYATGTFANYRKEEIKTILEGLGAEFASGYAKSLNYLIEGSLKSSSKVDKAKKDGIPVISEDKFLEMIGR